MANSIITVLGDGVTTQYPLNFTLGILKREYVTCRVGDEVDGLGDPAYRTLEWVTDGLVNIQGVVPGDDVPIVFTRTMPKNILLHDYSDGVPITEPNLDESNLQHIMSIHEFLDGRLEGGFVQELNMNNFKIINVAPGVDDTDAANMSQINAVIGDATDQADLAEEWATKTNGLVESLDNSSKAYAIGGTGVTNTAGKGAAKEWATKTGGTVDGTEYSAKKYAQDTAADRVATAADVITTNANVVTTNNNVTAAQAAQSAAEASANGMKWRPSVRAATTANITLSGAQTIDTVSVIAGDRVLVKNQSTASQNGVYVAAAGSWTRATDADSWAELVGQVVVVEEGAQNGDTPYICTVNAGGTIGSTAVTWAVIPTTIVDASVANAKLANMPAHTIKGSLAGGTPADLNSAQVTTVINNVVGDSGSGGTKGLAPAPAAGDAAAGKFLSADGTWKAPVLTKKFTSSEQTIPSAASTLTIAHGLGVTPSLFSLVALCKTASNGFSVGQEYPLSNQAFYYTYNGSGQVTNIGETKIWADATNIYFNYSNGGIMYDNISPGQTLTTANFKIVARAFA